MPQKTKSPISAGNFKVLDTFPWTDDKRMSQAWVLVGIPHLRRSSNSTVVFSWPCICATCWHSVSSPLYHQLHLSGHPGGLSFGNLEYWWEGWLEKTDNGWAATHCIPWHSLDTWSSPAVPCCLTSPRSRNGALAPSVPIPLLHACPNFRRNPTSVRFTY